jgi:hypothetical protein
LWEEFYGRGIKNGEKVYQWNLFSSDAAGNAEYSADFGSVFV